MMIKRLFFTIVLIHCLSLKAGAASNPFFEGDVLRAPFSGRFIPVSRSETLQAGDLIGYMEVMKARFPIYAPRDGFLSLPVSEDENGNIMVDAESVIGTFSPQTPNDLTKNSESFSTAPNTPDFSQIKIPQTDSPFSSTPLPSLERPSKPSEGLPLESSIVVLPNVKILSASQEEKTTNNLIPRLSENRTDPLLQKENPSPSLLPNLITGEDLEELFKARKYSLNSLKSIIQEYFKVNLLTFMTLVIFFYLGLLSVFIFIRNPRQQKLKKI